MVSDTFMETDCYGRDVDGARVRHSASQLDAIVLSALRWRGGLQTCVIASWIGASPGWERPQTDRVLRACRRLQKRGLIVEGPSSYAVMKTWRLAPTPETHHDR
jgi:hypothetical protein